MRSLLRNLQLLLLGNSLFANAVGIPRDLNITLEWHLPYGCDHHGFVTEMLTYIEALQGILYRGTERVTVTGLGPCSNKTLLEFGSSARALLKARQGAAIMRRRHCRLVGLASGEWGNECNDVLTEKNDDDNNNSIRDDDDDHDDHHHFSTRTPTIANMTTKQLIVVTHGEPCAMRPRSAFPGAMAIIGRTMTEGKLTTRQIECLRRAELDELWLPAPFHAQLFQSQGIGEMFQDAESEAGEEAPEGRRLPAHGGQPRLVVIPEATDVQFFSPLHARGHDDGLSINDRRAVAHFKAALPNHASTVAIAGTENMKLRDHESSLCAQAIESPASTRRREPPVFVVVSVFKWGYRKGWDILLEGFWRAFLDWKIEQTEYRDTASNRTGTVHVDTPRAVLCLRTSKPRIGLTGEVFESHYGGASGHNPRRSLPGADLEMNDGGEEIRDEVRAFAKHFLSSSYKQRRPFDSTIRLEGKLPTVEVLGSALSREGLRALIESADAFALPSRGEGWGLPVTEAMALEVPVVATFHAGPSSYLSSENSYPLHPSIVDDRDGSAAPPVLGLRDALRDIYKHWLLRLAAQEDDSEGQRDFEQTIGIKMRHAASDLKNEVAATPPQHPSPPPSKNPLHPRDRARNARMDVSRRFSPPVVAHLMAERLFSIAEAAGVS